MGKAILETLVTDSHNQVYFTYFNSSKSAKEIEKEYPNSRAIQWDLTNEPSLQKLLDQLPSMNLDVLVNNAISGMEVSHFHKTDVQVFERDILNNILPQVRLMQECVKLFRKKKSGKIITILTDFLIGTPPIGCSSYTASKAYLLSMVKAIAVENSKFNITSNAISPSLMKTELSKVLDERVLESMEANHPLKHLLPLQDVAELVSFLVNSTSHLNGVNIPVNAAVNVI